MASLLRNVIKVQNGGPPRPVSTQLETGEEQCFFASKPGIYDANGGKPLGAPAVNFTYDERQILRCTKIYKIATWNVRGMSQGKMAIVKRKMIRLNISLLWVSELHWKENGHFKSDDFSV